VCTAAVTGATPPLDKSGFVPNASTNGARSAHAIRKRPPENTRTLSQRNRSPRRRIPSPSRPRRAASLCIPQRRNESAGLATSARRSSFLLPQSCAISAAIVDARDVREILPNSRSGPMDIPGMRPPVMLKPSWTLRDRNACTEKYDRGSDGSASSVRSLSRMVFRSAKAVATNGVTRAPGNRKFLSRSIFL
jgi:hypothetical protein